jgi:hypothetical protein
LSPTFHFKMACMLQTPRAEEFGTVAWQASHSQQDLHTLTNVEATTMIWLYLVEADDCSDNLGIQFTELPPGAWCNQLHTQSFRRR